MTYLNGGYSIIKKDDANIFAKVNDALTSGKPILWYEYATTCYFIDSISKSGDDIVLTKGGKTITITDSNVVTEKGDLTLHSYILQMNLINNDESIDTYAIASFYTYNIYDEDVSFGYADAYNLLKDLGHYLNDYKSLPVSSNSNNIIGIKANNDKIYTYNSDDSSIEIDDDSTFVLIKLF